MVQTIWRNIVQIMGVGCYKLCEDNGTNYGGKMIKLCGEDGTGYGGKG